MPILPYFGEKRNSLYSAVFTLQRPYLEINIYSISSIIQNHNIDILADQIRQKIIRKVQGAKWFSVVADEVTDVSNKEQLSLVLRYVDPETLLVREDLVGLVECYMGIFGSDFAGKITSTLEAFGLDLSNLRGQAYDRAGS